MELMRSNGLEEQASGGESGAGWACSTRDPCDRKALNGLTDIVLQESLHLALVEKNAFWQEKKVESKLENAVVGA